MLHELQTADLQCELLDSDEIDNTDFHVDREGFLVLGRDSQIVRASVNSPIAAIRELFKILKYSPKVRSLFDSESESEQKRYSFPLDVSTCWSSTYSMLEFAVKHECQIRTFIKKFLEKNYTGAEATYTSYHLSISELRDALDRNSWECIKIVTNILKFFSRLTDAFSTAAANSENVLLTFFYVDDFFTNLLEDGTGDHNRAMKKYGLDELNGGKLPLGVRQALKIARDKASVYYGFADEADFLFICSLLDPRSKDRLLHVNLRDTITVKDIIRGVEANLVKYYNVLIEKPENISTETAAVVKEGDLFAEMLEEQIGSVSSPPSGTDNIIQEFQIYLNEDRLSPKLHLDLLSYWKTRSSTLSRLSRLSRMFLPSHNHPSQRRGTLALPELLSGPIVITFHEIRCQP
jgi:hypothetical protein